MTDNQRGQWLPPDEGGIRHKPPTQTTRWVFTLLFLIALCSVAWVFVFKGGPVPDLWRRIFPGKTLLTQRETQSPTRRADGYPSYPPQTPSTSVSVEPARPHPPYTAGSTPPGMPPATTPSDSPPSSNVPYSPGAPPNYMPGAPSVPGGIPSCPPAATSFSTASPSLRFTGRLQPEESALVYFGKQNISSGYGGGYSLAGLSAVIEHMYVKEGDTVARGQVLCRLTIPDAAERLSEAKRALESAKRNATLSANRPVILPDIAGIQRRLDDLNNQIRDAETKTPPPEEIEGLRKQKELVQKQLEQVRRVPPPPRQFPTASTNTEQIESAKRNLRALESILRGLTLRSPIAGRVFAVDRGLPSPYAGVASSSSVSHRSSVGVDVASPYIQPVDPFPRPGRTVTVNTPLFVVASGCAVAGTLTQEAVARIAIGRKAKAISKASPKTIFVGKVSRIGYVGQPSGASVIYPVTVKIFGDAAKLRLGMDMDVVIDEK